MNHQRSGYFSQVGNDTVKNSPYNKRNPFSYETQNEFQTQIKRQLTQYQSPQNDQNRNLAPQQQQYRQQQYPNNPYQNQPYAPFPSPIIMHDQFIRNFMNNSLFNQMPQQNYGYNQSFQNYNLPIYISSPIQKHTPMVIGHNNQNMKTSSMDNDYWRKYPVGQINLEDQIKQRDLIQKNWGQVLNKDDDDVVESEEEQVDDYDKNNQFSNYQLIQKQTIKPQNLTPKVKKYKNRAEKNLKLFFIRWSFIVLYFLALKKVIIQKKKLIYSKSHDTINKSFLLGIQWSLTCSQKFLGKFWNSSDKYDWIGEEKLSDKEKQSRSKRCMFFLDSLINILLENSVESKFDIRLLMFLGDITQNYQFPPQNFYFNFEINRLSFTSFTGLKDMTKQKQKLVMANFMLIRIIGYTILYSPWNLGLDGVKMNNLLKANCTMLTSILHELVVSKFRQEISLVKDNQKHLAREDKLTARSQGPLKYQADPTDANERQNLKRMMEPLIYPIYSKKELTLIFDQETQWVDSMKDKLNNLYERLVKIVNDSYLREKTKRKKVSILQSM